MDFVRNHKGLTATLAVVFVLLIAVVGFVSSVNSTNNTLIQKEQSLAAQYQSNQNELSTYTLTVKESLGVANTGTDKLNQVLSDAIMGRYDGKMTPGTGGSMFSAIQEAYPNLTATSASYAKVQDLVVSGRNSFKNVQNQLQDKLRDYNTWISTDFFRSFIVKNVLGAPTNNLKVTVGQQTFHGQDALDKMSQLVLSTDAVNSYQTGTTGPLIDGTATTSTPTKAAKK